MPTKDQAKEMLDGTTPEWTTINGVNGGKFTSKTDTSKYIFLPAGGYWNDTTHNASTSIGNYWSTTFDTSDNLNAWYMYLDTSYLYVNRHRRKFGHFVRAN